MAHEVMTEVTAVVAGDRAADVVAAFEALLGQPRPDGLLRTELLAGADGEWRIQSLWRDRAALDAMRAGAVPPAAPTLFRQVGAEPTLGIHEVRATSDAPGVVDRG